MIIRTESGSVYEVDLHGRRARRLSGERAPSPRLGADGEWRAFEEIYAVVGDPMLFTWSRETEEDKVRAKCTETSPIKSIEGLS